MKTKLLSLVLFFTMVQALAQQYPFTLTIFDEVIYYDGYANTVDAPVPSGIIRHNNTSYAKMLTEDQLASFGNKLTMNVTIKAACDNYDRIGNANLAFVPKGSTSYAYNDVQRIEIGRYITPFMDKNQQPDSVPYIYEIDNIAKIFKDPSITSVYDIWVELEVFGVPYAANEEIVGCAGRNDVFKGSLEFISDINSSIADQGQNFFTPIINKFQMRDYTLDGTDILGQTTKTVSFTLEEDMPNAKFYVITSNHGAGTNGEEYVRRWHYIYLDGAEVLKYKPGGVSCVPYSIYNTQVSCIYYDCSQNPAVPRPDTDSAWSWNNWCPGSAIPTRVIELGNLSAGEHSFKIDVPSAIFYNDDGVFPLSVYLQGYTETLNNTPFDLNTVTVTPNPFSENVQIQSTGLEIKAVIILNTLGQPLYSGTSTNLNLSSLQSGTYFMHIEFTNSKQVVKKLIKI